jgi:hypothetical protein
LFNKLQMMLTGKKVGTDAGRFVAATLMVAPLLLIDLRLAILWPFVVTAAKIGYFDDAMGLVEPWRDHLFLGLWGVVVVLIATAPLYISPALFSEPPTLTLAITPPWWAPIGVFAVAAYAINKPFDRAGIGSFQTDWTERAEFMTGCCVGLALWGAVAWR